MADYTFTADAGVRFGDDIKFERSPELDPGDGSKKYRFTTQDAKVAARLRKLSDYGITEVKGTASVDTGDA